MTTNINTQPTSNQAPTITLNKLPTLHKRSILDYLPIRGTTTSMQLVNKHWEKVLPFEGHLDVSHLKIDDADLEKIIKHFQGKDIKIISINLDRCKITANLNLLASSHFPIQRLNLKLCRLTDDGLKHLTALPLKELDLSFCKITDDGLKDLATLPLTKLSLAYCPITDDGLKHIAPSRLLTKLDVSVTQVTDKGLGYLTGLPLAELVLRQCDKLSGFFSTFPTLLFPQVPPESYRLDYTDRFIDLFPIKEEMDVQRVRRGFAEGLPPLCPSSQLRIFSTYVSSDFRSKLAEKTLPPLLLPLPSIQHLIAPLRTFAKRETDADPKFAIYFNHPAPRHKNTAGGYTSYYGTIEMFIQDQNQEIDTTCLLHELSHKAYDKLGWKTADIDFLKEQAFADIDALKVDGWKSCDPAVKQLLEPVHLQYLFEKRFEEYLVRMPEIITRMAQNAPSDQFSLIEKRIQQDLPHLYEIYAKKFLPQLEQYNKTH